MISRLILAEAEASGPRTVQRAGIPDVTWRQVREAGARGTRERQGAEASLPTERRNVSTRRRLLQRIEREYREMPGLSLTNAQARRLFGLDTDVCLRVLRELIDMSVLRLTPRGLFVRCDPQP